MAIAKIKERWAEHPTLDVEVSTLGRIRIRGKLRKSTLHHSGYLVVTMGFGGPQRSLHTLVLETHQGPRPLGTECRHLDGNKQNCCLSNLQWGTKKQNLADQKKHGVYARPPIRRKFDLSIYYKIFDSLDKGAAIKTLVKQFGVSRSAIYRQMRIERFRRGNI